jgi:HD-like signal output (HDOD) protein
MKKNILIVDDDITTLSSLREILDTEAYNFYQAENAENALKMVEQNKINLFISNLNLPGMDGIALLKKIKRQSPLTIRLAYSETSSEVLFFKLFNNNLCKQLLESPIDKYGLVKIVNGLFAMEEKLRARELLSTINMLDKLPVLPDTYINVNQMIEDEEDIDNIAAVIEKDASLSLKILQVANSAFYRIKTGSIKTAIMTLGLVNIKNIILTTSIFDFFDNNSHRKKLLWKHALTTNNIVLGIYRTLLNKGLSNLYSSAGMLHDVGKIVLCKNYPENYMKIFQMVHDNRVTFTEAENEVLNISNGEVGAYLLDWWDIPSPIVEAALFHETPQAASEANRELLSVIHIASYYSWKSQNIITGEQIDESAFTYLGFSKYDCEKLIMKIVEERN